jgi:hypothetical protein
MLRNEASLLYYSSKYLKIIHVSVGILLFSMFVCHAEERSIPAFTLLKQMIKKTQLRVYCFINAISFVSFPSFNFFFSNC